MALDKLELEFFKSELLRASQTLGSTELSYRTEWIFVLPTASLKIAGVALHEQFNIHVGLTGFGLDDLNELTKEGFLTLVSESEEDSYTLEKTITYRIKSQSES